MNSVHAEHTYQCFHLLIAKFISSFNICHFQTVENMFHFALSKLSVRRRISAVRYGFRGNIIFAPQGVHARRARAFFSSLRIINDFFLAIPPIFSSSTVVWGNNYLAVSSIPPLPKVQEHSFDFPKFLIRLSSLIRLNVDRATRPCHKPS